jgi:hypothetical protein
LDSAQHCLDQLAEYRRLMKSTQSETEVHALKHICRSWTALAGQIDRYYMLVRGVPAGGAPHLNGNIFYLLSGRGPADAAFPRA